MASNDLFIEFLEKTKHLSKHWKELGVMLRLEKHQLDEIESNYPRDVGRCRMDMLSTWLKNNPADPAAELDTALDELQRTVHGDQQVTLDHDIQTRINNLRTEFAAIVVQALKWLDHHYPETKDAVRWLNESLRGLQSEPLPVPSSSVSDTVPLDEQLQKRWSFTNPAILEGLVEKTNERDLIEKMKKYNENFKYVRCSIPISNQEIIFEPFNSNKPCLILIFKNITYFDDIDLFLREVFDIYRRYLRVHKIEPGCVKVTLQFDATVESLLQACIDKKREAVKHYATMHVSQTETPETVASPTEDQSVVCIAPQEVSGVPKTQPHRSNRPTKYIETRRSHSFTETQPKTYAGTKSHKRERTTDPLFSKKYPLCKKMKDHVVKEIIFVLLFCVFFWFLFCCLSLPFLHLSVPLYLLDT